MEKKFYCFGSMLLTCKKCDTIFSIDQKKITSKYQKVRCSVCANIWVIKDKNYDHSIDEHNVQKDFKSFKFLIVLIFLITFFSGTFIYRNIVTAQFPELISVFNYLGLKIEPDLRILKLQNIKINYENNIIRIYGELANKHSFKTHASSVQIIIYDKNDLIIKKLDIEPENRLINSNDYTEFFVQFDFEGPDVTKVLINTSSKQIK